MLVLSRRKNEQIVIGDGITITMIRLRNGAAMLGIEAPPEVPVNRREVYEALKRIERKAS